MFTSSRAAFTTTPRPGTRTHTKQTITVRLELRVKAETVH